MNKCICYSFFVAAVLGAFLACGKADQAPGDKTKGSYTGAIETLDLQTRVLKVKSELSSMTFLVSKEAKIVVRENENARLSDLKAGDKVIVEYEEKSGIKIALRVSLKEQKTPPLPTAGEPLIPPQ